MINLEIGTQEVCLTLKENTTISNPYYVFEFYSNATKKTITFLCEDVNAGLPEDVRFNKFLITLVESESEQNLEQGIIYLPNTGYYQYKAYAQTTNTLPLDSNAELVEHGKVLYGFSDATITTFNPDIDIIVYNG